MTEINTPEIIPSINGTDGREACSKFWIAAYTRPRSEKKACLELKKNGIEAFVPIQRQLRNWNDRRKYVEVPVIPMILFAKISNVDVLKIKAHPLIIRIVSYPGRKLPAHIPSHQIEYLKYMLGQSEIPVSFEQGSFKSDEFVTIARGCLMGVTGQIKMVKEDMTDVWVSIDMLGGTVVRIKSSDLIHNNQ